MTLNDYVESQKRVILRGYVNDPERIASDYNKENESIKGYQGRELLELLQNAVDELGGKKEKRVQVELTGDILTISNNGNVFTENGVKSLLYSSLSPKFKKLNYIGNKGTGFRSILNWAKKVCIYSGDLSIEFDRKHATCALNKLLVNENIRSHKEEYESDKKEQLKIATLVVPEVISPIVDREYDTSIQIMLNNPVETIPRIRQQLEQIDSKSLLFLKKLERLIIIDNGKKRELRKKSSSNGENKSSVMIREYIDGKKNYEENWTILNSHGEYASEGEYCGKKYEIAVAFKPGKNIIPGNLYSFFKTDVPFPLPVVVHGSFDLDQERNHLEKNEVNKFILTELCSLIVVAAKSIASDEISYAPLRLLAITRNNDFSNELSWLDFSFKKIFRSAILTCQILPTVNDEYISFHDSPKLHNVLAKYLKGGHFEKLLKHTDDEDITGYISSVLISEHKEIKYEYNDLVKRIDSTIPSLSIRERASCASAFRNEYRNTNNTKYPLFPVDTDGNNVITGQRIFLQPQNKEDMLSLPPAFVKICYLNQEFRKEFELGAADNKQLKSDYECYNISEYNVVDIIKAITSKLSSNLNRENCIDAVKWIWNNRKFVNRTTLEKIEFYMISKTDEIKKTGELYWGAECGNTIMESLLIDCPQFFVAYPDIYDIGGDDVSEFIRLFTSLGVAELPRIKVQRVNTEFDNIRYMLSFPVIAGDISEYDFDNDVRSQDLHLYVEYIEHYPQIVKNAKTRDILSWLNQDENAMITLSRQNENTDSELWLKTSKQTKLRKVSGDKLKSYMRLKFCNDKWIEIDGKKYAPKDCILNDIGDKLYPVLIAPHLEDFVIDNNNKRNEMSEIKRTLTKFGVHTGFRDLSTSTLYRVLQFLSSEKDKDGKISREIYDLFLSRYKNEVLKNDEAPIEFLKNGKVFTKKHGFVPVADVHFLPRSDIASSITDLYKLIDISPKKDAKAIEHALGVKILSLTGELIREESHSLANEFIADFDECKVFVFCHRVENVESDEILRVKSLNIDICKEVLVEYDGNQFQLKDFEYYLDNESAHAFIKIPNDTTTIEDLKGNVDMAEAVAQIFISVCKLPLTSSDTVKYLYGINKKNREKSILKEFDNLDIISKSRGKLGFTLTKEEQFIRDCENISEAEITERISPLVKNINFDRINDIKNSSVFIEILRILNIDVEEFNNRTDFEIDLKPHYGQQLENISKEYLSQFKDRLYQSLLDKDVSVQEGFIEAYESYLNSEYPIDNSIYFDFKKIFFDKWNLTEDMHEQSIADSEYKKTYDLLKNGKEKSILDELLRDDKNQSLVYFDIDELNRRYFILASEKNDEEDVPPPIDDDDIPDNPTSVKPSDPKDEAEKPSSKGRSKDKNPDKKSNKNKEQGLNAERYVFNKLCKRYGNSVKWVSENARADGTNPDGRDGDGYDITYVDDDGNQFYVEVKSTKGNKIDFNITPNELEFGENHANNYEVILVTNWGKDLKIKRLQNLFCYSDNEDRHNNNKFRLDVVEEFSISCEEEYDDF